MSWRDFALWPLVAWYTWLTRAEKAIFCNFISDSIVIHTLVYVFNVYASSIILIAVNKKTIFY